MSMELMALSMADVMVGELILQEKWKELIPIGLGLPNDPVILNGV